MKAFRPALLATALLAACTNVNTAPATTAATPVPAAVAEDSAALAAFFKAYDDKQLALSPLSKAYRGIVDADNGAWGDFSDAAAVREHQLDVETLAAMKARFDPNQLSPADRLSYDLFGNMVARNDGAFRFRKNAYLFDQMNGAQSDVPAFLINIHRVTDLATAEAYVSRLEGIDEVMDQLIAEARERAANGVLPPKWVYPFVIGDSKNVMAGAPFGPGPDSALFADLKAKVTALSIPEAEKSRLIEKGRAALVTQAQPAYARVVALMMEQQKVAGTDDGVWRFADGAAYYNERLGFYTTTDMTADEIHQLGLDNVARIHGEMRAIMAKVGFKGTLNDFFEHLRTSDQYYYATREAYLADVAAKLDAMKAKLPAYFGRLPKAELTVKPVEAFREKSAGKAFYQGPTPDGSRPGVYYVNLYNLRDMPKTELEALVYHEGVPGHHLQRTIQTELGDVPPFRKFGGFTAYTEGWGLYTEELGKDMGFYADPYSDFGRLGMELWRACRLVVDTGIHHKRWTREQAIQYLKANTPNPDGDIEKAIERYIVYPGQATAYMIGKLKIMELRERAMQRLGDRFDWRGFHDAVLLTGPVPLDVLDETVSAWIAKSAANVGFVQSAVTQGD